MEKNTPKYQNHVLVAIVLLLFGITIATAQYKVIAINPTLEGLFSMKAGSSSWLMSIFTFVGIVLAIPTGELAKRFGPKMMLFAATVVMLIGSLFGAFCGSGTLLIVSRAIEGISLIFVTICGPLAVQKYCAPEKVGSATGIWALWVCLGSVVGGTLTPSLYTATGFQGVWIIYAAAAVVTAILIAVLIKEPGKNLTASIGEANEAVAAEPQEKIGYASLFKPNILIFLAAWTIFNLVLLAMLNFSPTFMQQQNMDPTLSGFVTTLPMLLAVISSPLFGWLYDKTGKLKVLLAIAMLALGPCAFVLLTMTGPMMWAAAVVMGLVGLGAPVTFINSLFKITSPKVAAIAMGLFMLIQSLGQFLGSFIPPMILGSDMSSWMLTGIVMLVLGLVGVGCVLLTRFEAK